MGEIRVEGAGPRRGGTAATTSCGVPCTGPPHWPGLPGLWIHGLYGTLTPLTAVWGVWLGSGLASHPLWVFLLWNRDSLSSGSELIPSLPRGAPKTSEPAGHWLRGSQMSPTDGCSVPGPDGPS